MISIEGKKREVLGKKVKNIKKQGILPGVVYGPEVKSFPIEISAIEFKKLYAKAGESSLIALKVSSKEYLVLIYDTKRDPLTNEFIHVDFYQPILTKEVEASIPLVFEGESAAIKDLGGTLVKGAQEIEVKALPQNLPHEIRVDISILKTFEDEILVKNLILPPNVTVTKNPEDIIAVVTPPEKVEEELEKPIEEKVDEVGEAVEKKSAEEEEGEPAAAEPGKKEQK